MNTRIIVDSTADLTPEIKSRVHTVPLTVLFGAEEYIDGVTIDHKSFYEKLIESDVLPTTSQATPEAFAREFDKAKQAEEAAEAVAGFEQRYDEILQLAELEYAESPPTKYYRDGYNLFLRLRDYRESELRFLHDMRVEPDNSLCERLARVFKRKQRQAIVFRSFEYLGYVCDSIAAVNNMRLGGKDVFAESTAIFDRPMPVEIAPTEESVAMP